MRACNLFRHTGLVASPHRVSSSVYHKAGRYSSFSTTPALATTGDRGNTVGFIGLGAMGNHMLNNLISRYKQPSQGSSVSFALCDTNQEAIEQVIKRHNVEHPQVPLISCSSPYDVAQKASTIISMVPTGVVGAEQGTLAIMVGGSKTSFDRSVPVLESMSRKVTYCGDLGAGLAAKIANKCDYPLTETTTFIDHTGPNSLLLGITMAGLSEAMLLGKRLGVDPQVLADIINNSTGRCWSSEINHPVPEIKCGNSSPPACRGYEGGFVTKLAHKDLAIAVSAAQEANVPLAVGNCVEELYRPLACSKDNVVAMDKPSPIVISGEKLKQTPQDSFPDRIHGNVVWKTLFSNPSTTSDSMCAGIATCPPQGSLALHQHTQAEIYYILEGSGHVEIDGVSHHVTEGSVVWIPGDAVHGVFCGPDETLKWLYVFAEGCDDVYGPGTWIDSEALPVPDDARRLLKILADATPGFTKDPSVLDSMIFTGSAQTITPGPLKSSVIAAALHAMGGIVANELLELRDGQNSNRNVLVDTDQAAFWLGTVGLSKHNGRTVRELAKNGKLASIFPKDLERDIFGTPLKLRATANYETKDDSVWFQLHGSLGAEPVLKTIGLDPTMQCASNDEAYKVIAENVRKFGAHELEMMHFVQGLCGSICYTPAGWEQTRMAKDLSKHPLINYKQQTHAVPTPAIPLPVSTDKRPLAGIKVVELVRIIAGPVIGTTLASLGADVIRVNCSRLPDFNSLQLSLNAGVRTVDIDLAVDEDLKHLMELIEDADVFVQGYRPGVIARKGLSLNNLLEMAAKRGKGIVYVEENCYGPDGPMAERPGWQQIADAATGCSYVTGRSLGHEDGTCVLPALPVPDMLTGLIGAIGAMMAIRDRARQGGSYHVFASLMAAAGLHLKPEIGLYSPEVVEKCNQKFKWGKTGPDHFVLELLDVVLDGWKREMPGFSEKDSPYMSALKGEWGELEVLKPVIRLSDPDTSPCFSSAPEPNCYRSSSAMAWI
ncbi:unnamed protein product [Fusarium graminearum]|nr:unnamed protein product [Fusarium graminearum]